MKALKCDNCGGYFDYGKTDDVNEIAYGHEFVNGNVDYYVYKNLCPACMAAVMKALDDRKRRAIDPMEDDLK